VHAVVLLKEYLTPPTLLEMAILQQLAVACHLGAADWSLASAI
jgi:hypothetical protein